MSITTTAITPTNTFLSSLTSSLLAECRPSCSLTLQPAYATWSTNSSIPPLATTVLLINPTNNQTSTSIDCNTQVLSDYYLSRAGGAQRVVGVDDNCRLIGNFPNIEQVAGINSFYTTSATVTYPASYLDIGIRFGAAGIFSTVYANGSSKCLTFRNSYLTGAGKTYSGQLTTTVVTETGIFSQNVTGITTATITRTYTLMPQLTDYYPDDPVVQQCASYVSFETSPNTLTAANYLTSVRTLPGAAPVLPSPEPSPQPPSPPAQSPNPPSPQPPAQDPTPGNTPVVPLPGPTGNPNTPAPSPESPPSNPAPAQPQQPGIGNLISAIIGVGQGPSPANPTAPGNTPPDTAPPSNQADPSPDVPQQAPQDGPIPAPTTPSGIPTTLPLVILNGQTALPGGPALQIAGKTVSMAPGGVVVVGSTTVPFADAPGFLAGVPGLQGVSVGVTSRVVTVPAEVTGTGGRRPEESDVASYIVSGIGGQAGVGNGTGTGGRPAQYTGGAGRITRVWTGLLGTMIAVGIAVV
ncbi:hypothetical protein CAC42_5572 [Sphaceloma murrayae]|uniref:Uncharacterized protein n=1 Tax=Sphaceloma murrayae TaxID=2082308 RepID=A0A2K1QYJ4_9PEZI|nr:hypothetical protein CAC42_5572 [Sphaceloma murrayae]